MRTVLSLFIVGFLVGSICCFGYFHSRPVPVAATPVNNAQAIVNDPFETTVLVPLKWALLDNTNYTILASNLSSINCPRQTITDIVMARILFDYKERRNHMQNPMMYHWQTDEEAAAYKAQLNALLSEQAAALRPFLPPAPIAQADPVTKSTLPFTADQLQKIADITKQYPNNLLSATATQAEVDEFYNNRKARLAYLAQYLTPDELTNYRLNQDSDINTVSLVMKPLNLTQAELNSIAFALDFTSPNMNNGKFAPEVEAAFQQGLSADRYAQYQAAYSPNNMAMTEFIMQVNVTPEEVTQLEAMQGKASTTEISAAITQMLGNNAANRYATLLRQFPQQ